MMLGMIDNLGPSLYQGTHLRRLCNTAHTMPESLSAQLEASPHKDRWSWKTSHEYVCPRS